MSFRVFVPIKEMQECHLSPYPLPPSFCTLSPLSLLSFTVSLPPLSQLYLLSLPLSFLSLTVSLPLSLTQPLSLSLSEIYIQIHFASLNLDLQEENVVGSKFMLKRSKVELRWERANPR